MSLLFGLKSIFPPSFLIENALYIHFMVEFIFGNGWLVSISLHRGLCIDVLCTLCNQIMYIM